MTIWEALLYGAVQGVAEYLPISSHAHLILLPRFLGSQEYGLAFDVFLHVGTLAATLIYFRKDWIWIARHAWDRRVSESHPRSLSVKLLALATLPALVGGVIVKKLMGGVLDSNAVIAGALVVGGLLLYLVDRSSKGMRSLESATVADAWKVGLFQCLALVPGMSRSGSTILGARALGFSRDASARFSFLISAPVMLAAIVYEARDVRVLLETRVDPLMLGLATLSSFVFGILSIAFLLRLLRNFGYLLFALYRIALAIAIVWILGV
jgi:undecaprenyl-diphosphatase